MDINLIERLRWDVKNAELKWRKANPPIEEKKVVVKTGELPEMSLPQARALLLSIQR
jgi:hypothetical protein